MPSMNARDALRLTTVVETAVDGVILIDAQGIVMMFNAACEKLFGYRKDEVVGQNVKMLMPPPYQGEHDGYLDNYRKTGKAKIIGVDREVTGRRKDGTTFPMNLSVGEAKEEGAPVYVGIIHDLTEKKRAEQAVREGTARLRAVVDTAVDGVILINAKGLVLMFNPACEKLFGFKAGEVIGENVKMLMPDPYHQEHDRYIANYQRTGEAKIIGIGREVVGRRKDGSTFPMDLSVGEAKQEGESIFVGIIHDLTDRKRIQQQLAQAQKMEAVGQLSGGIAHDFNNLLTIIIGNAETLAVKLDARPDMKRLAEAIVGAGERGAELTQRLLAFSRRQMLQPVEIDCNRMVETMREILRRTLTEDIDIRVTLEKDLWSAFADPAQLENAILNLSLNARDAMPNGGCLTLSTANVPLENDYQQLHPEVPPGQYVMVAISDDGVGMPPEVREHAFEPFFTTKEVGKGTGLGLSMVYGFAKQSNGHVTIYSEPGLGTTVRIYLPAGSVTLVKPQSAEAPMAAPSEARNANTILVVEDDPFVRNFAVSTIQNFGYRVIAAVDAQEALTRLNQSEPIDILFTDIVMPGSINGLQLADQAKKLRPGIKILLTSGYALETLASRGRLPQGVTILHKPYRKAELAKRLSEVLQTAS